MPGSAAASLAAASTSNNVPYASKTNICWTLLQNYNLFKIATPKPEPIIQALANCFKAADRVIPPLIDQV
jgi:predicted acyltransferase